MSGEPILYTIVPLTSIIFVTTTWQLYLEYLI